MSLLKSKDADAPVVEDTHRIQEDVDAAFKETVMCAMTKIEVKEAIKKPTMDDQNKTFHIWLIAFWMLMNAGLAVVIENINGLTSAVDAIQDASELQTKQNMYFAVILYSTFGLAAVRFTGVGCFFLRRFVTHWWDELVFVVIVQMQLLQVLQGELEDRNPPSYRYAFFFCMDSDQLSSTFLDNQGSHSAFHTGRSILHYMSWSLTPFTYKGSQHSSSVIQTSGRQ